MVPTKGRNRKRIIISRTIYVLTYGGGNVFGAEMLDVSLLGVGTVLRLEQDAWSMV